MNDQGYVFKPTVSQQRGGGIAISFRKNINITEVDKSGEKSTFEFVKSQAITDHHNFCLFGIYHPPPSEQHQFTNQQLTDELAETLVSVLTKSKNILAIGDLNIHVNNLEYPENILLSDTILDSGYPIPSSYHPRFRISDTILDSGYLIPSWIQDIRYHPGFRISDTILD